MEYKKKIMKNIQDIRQRDAGDVSYSGGDRVSIGINPHVGTTSGQLVLTIPDPNWKYDLGMVKPKQKLSELSIADLIALWNLSTRIIYWGKLDENTKQVKEEINKRIDNIDWDN